MREMAKHCGNGAHDNVVSARPRGIRDAHGSSLTVSSVEPWGGAPAGRIRRQVIATQTGRTLHRPQLLLGHAGTHTHWRERGQALWVTGVSGVIGGFLSFWGGVLSDTYPNVSHMYPAWILGVSCCFSHDSMQDTFVSEKIASVS